MSGRSVLSVQQPRSRAVRTRATLVWLNSVHGRHADWVRNLEVTPAVRIKLGGRWHHGHATVHDYHADIVRRFNLYARAGPRTLGIDPALVRVQLRRRSEVGD